MFVRLLGEGLASSLPAPWGTKGRTGRAASPLLVWTVVIGSIVCLGLFALLVAVGLHLVQLLAKILQTASAG